MQHFEKTVKSCSLPGNLSVPSNGQGITYAFCEKDSGSHKLYWIKTPFLWDSVYCRIALVPVRNNYQGCFPKASSHRGNLVQFLAKSSELKGYRYETGNVWCVAGHCFSTIFYAGDGRCTHSYLNDPEQLPIVIALCVLMTVAYLSDQQLSGSERCCCPPHLVVACRKTREYTNLCWRSKRKPTREPGLRLGID